MFTDLARIDQDDQLISVVTSEDHANAHDTVHGGLMATMLDTAMGAAARTVTEDGQHVATVAMTVTFLRPGKIGSTLEATGKVRQRGDSLVMVEAEVTDKESGKPVATAVGTFTVLDKKDD